MSTARTTRSTLLGITMAGSLGIATLAGIGAAQADPPGNNGTWKLHEITGEERFEDNDPKVCRFNIEAFDLDAEQFGTVKIEPQGQDTDTTATLTLNLSDTNGDGDGQTVYINADPAGETDGFSLPDGHYKVTLYNKNGTETDLKSKSKVFKVRCDDTPPTTTTTSTPPPSTTTTTTSTPPPSTTTTTPPPSTSTTTTTPPPSTSTTTPPPSTTSTPPETTTTTPPPSTHTSSTHGTPPPTTDGTPPGGTEPGSSTGPVVSTGVTGDGGPGAAGLAAIGLTTFAAIIGAGAFLRRRLTHEG